MASIPFMVRQYFVKAAYGSFLDMDIGHSTSKEQRLAGTIDKAIPGSQKHKKRALVWLRKNVPFDEDRAIRQRLEREEKAALQPQGQQKGGNVYGESVLEQMRKEIMANQERERREREVRSKIEAKEVPLSPEQALVRRREESARFIQKWRDYAKKDELSSVPQMGFIQRVGRPTLLSFAVISLSVMFAQNYSPPSEAARLFSSVSPAAATIGVLIGLNCLVWFGWRLLFLRRVMNRVFVLVPAYPWTSSMIGSLFSHPLFRHLAINMFALCFVGNNCKRPLSLF
ncbi:MAG: hypothetical protein Q9219_005259 [cf. Caloplaca sp. 3 TL-2023]